MNAEISKLYRGLSNISAKYLKKRFVLTSGDRSCSRQVEISGATSFHVVGEAFDAVVVPYSKAEQAWLGALAESVGFRWGGRFKGNYDDVHFDNGNRTVAGRCP
jgi:hypothetical protein